MSTASTSREALRRWVTRYSEQGLAYRVLETSVPAIQPELLECVFYAYPNSLTARGGEKIGGTGFLVGVQLEVNKAWIMLYAVTNRHVLKKSGDHLAIRLNKLDGTNDVIETETRQWHQHADLFDVAVLPIELSVQHRYRYVTPDSFVTRQMVDGYAIGPGDDVFMVGRFISHEGKEKNLPAVRFGNIAMMPAEPILDSYSISQESFLVECRSVPGYSGSPVFLFINPTLPRPPLWLTPAMRVYNPKTHGPWLLGIDWCHLSDYKPVLAQDKETPIDPKEWVELNTAMAGVVPAWRLLELLNDDELVMQRKRKDEAITEDKNRSPAAFDSAPASFTKTE